jgi:hypothetical protein
MPRVGEGLPALLPDEGRHALSTPWKSSSGGPSRRPPVVTLNSRIVSSCAPVRFLTAEIARRTRPAASKKRSRTTVSLR